ncbi:MAG: hypothetical protein PF961_00825 [Planctomycetota bacterium]|jgi:hypothetical protein|nr:hypothetical protein [Planctomycetota bacterium]
MTPAPNILLWSAATWLLVIPLAVANGVLRQAVLIPWLGTKLAYPISGALLIAAIAAVACLLVSRLGPRHAMVWVSIGIAWGTATFCFELLMLRAANKGWDALVQQYNFSDNNIWPLVMVWTLLAPLLVATWRKQVQASTASY